MQLYNVKVVDIIKRIEELEKTIHALDNTNTLKKDLSNEYINLLNRRVMDINDMSTQDIQRYLFLRERNKQLDY